MTFPTCDGPVCRGRRAKWLAVNSQTSKPRNWPGRRGQSGWKSPDDKQLFAKQERKRAEKSHGFQRYFKEDREVCFSLETASVSRKQSLQRVLLATLLEA